MAMAKVPEIVVSSPSEAELESVQRIFKNRFHGRVFIAFGLPINVDVAPQPVGVKEGFTVSDAKIAVARDTHPGATYYIASSHAIEKTPSGTKDIACVTIANRRGQRIHVQSEPIYLDRNGKYFAFSKMFGFRRTALTMLAQDRRTTIDNALRIASNEQYNSGQLLDLPISKALYVLSPRRTARRQ